MTDSDISNQVSLLVSENQKLSPDTQVALDKTVVCGHLKMSTHQFEYS
jgi:hypothetical protein